MEDGLALKPQTAFDLRQGAPRLSKEQAEKTAKEFEAFFLTQMMAHMFEGIKADGMFGGGQGEEMFKSLLVDEYGKMMAKQGGVGIADQVKAHMLKMQEV